MNLLFVHDIKANCKNVNTGTAGVPQSVVLSMQEQFSPQKSKKEFTLDLNMTMAEERRFRCPSTPHSTVNVAP